MEKTIFNNHTFYIAIIVVLGILLCWNLYNFLISKNFISLIPALIQAVVLILVMTRNKHAKLGIQIWAIILIVGPGLSILGKAIKIFLGDPLNEISPLIIQFVILLIGFTVYNYNNATVEVKVIEEYKKE